MSTPAEEFPEASFDDLAFAYSELSVKGGIRYAMHEFPHAAGGEPEKMGRKAYVASFRAHFHDVPKSSLATKYPDAYPNGLRLMREKFEVQLTAWLVIPTVGKIKAVATDWLQRYDARTTTGESFDIEFVEDQRASFLVSALTGTTGAALAVSDASDALFAKAALADYNKPATVGFFQSLNDAVTLVQGALDSADAFNNVLAGKLHALANLCAYADNQLEEFQDPSNHVVINALKDLQLAVVQLTENMTNTSQRLLTYTTPKLMTIGQVSTVLYGTSERGSDILQINAIDDAFAIPAGTALKYVTG